jgi:hypothetical protein
MLGDAGCDPSCAGSCDDGRCLFVEPVGGSPNVPGAQGNSIRIAVDGTNVYWTETTGNIVAAPLDGGTPVTLAGNETGAFGITVTGGDLYWTRALVDAGSVERMPVGGGTPETIATAQNVPQDITTDGVRVYWATSPMVTSNTVPPCAIVSAPLDGGAPATLASGQTQPLGLAVQGGSLYWVAADSLMGVALDGGSPVTLATLPPPYPPAYDDTSPSAGLAVDGQDAYWLRSPSDGVSPDQVYRVPLSGGTFVPVAGAGDAYAVATDGTSLYAVGSSVVRVPVDGGAPTTLVSPLGPTPYLWGSGPMFLDATHLFWNTRIGAAILSPR